LGITKPPRVLIEAVRVPTDYPPTPHSTKHVNKLPSYPHPHPRNPPIKKNLREREKSIKGEEKKRRI
jgi:hypothetical protein